MLAAHAGRLDLVRALVAAVAGGADFAEALRAANPPAGAARIWWSAQRMAR